MTVAVLAGEAVCAAAAVVCAVLCVRNAHRAQRAAKRAQDATSRSLRVAEPDPELVRRAQEFDRQAIAAMQERARREGRA